MNHLQKLRSLKIADQEGEDLRNIIDRVLTIAEISAHETSIIKTLQGLKGKIDPLAKRWLEKSIDIQTYTLDWDQIVRDSTKAIEELEKN